MGEKEISCPNCQSEEIEKKEFGNDNGIVGPGYKYYVILEFCVCKKCGVMFKDLNKK